MAEALAAVAVAVRRMPWLTVAMATASCTAAAKPAPPADMVRAERCTLTRLAEVTLDAGAFGRGAALDRVRRVVEGTPGAWLADLDGQVAVGGGPWPVALAHPEHRDRSALDLRLSGGSLATSGGVVRDRTLKDGVRIGHVLDPRTGRSVVRRGSMSVWHPDALAADALSTALQVMGPEEGLRWAAERGIAACFLMPDDRAGGKVVMLPTPEFRRRFRLDRPALDQARLLVQAGARTRPLRSEHPRRFRPTHHRRGGVLRHYCSTSHDALYCARVAVSNSPHASSLPLPARFSMRT